MDGRIILDVVQLNRTDRLVNVRDLATSWLQGFNRKVVVGALPTIKTLRSYERVEKGSLRSNKALRGQPLFIPSNSIYVFCFIPLHIGSSSPSVACALLGPVLHHIFSRRSHATCVWLLPSTQNETSFCHLQKFLLRRM